jgi:hypothetical protein
MWEDTAQVKTHAQIADLRELAVSRYRVCLKMLNKSISPRRPSSQAFGENIVACWAVSRQELGKHVPAETDTHSKIEAVLETVFSTRSVQKGYKEDN